MTRSAGIARATPGEVEVGIDAGAVIDDRYQLITPVERAARTDTWRAYDLRLRREVELELVRQGGSVAEPVDEPVDELQSIVENYAARATGVLDAGQGRAFGCSYVYVVTAATVTPAVPDCDDTASPLPVGEWA